jgi:hypothetical protein
MTSAGTPATSVRAGTSFVHDGAGGHDRVVPDHDALEDRRAGGDPHAAADGDRRGRDLRAAERGVQRMARADQLHVRPDHHVVTDVDDAQVHRGAAVIHEHVAAEAQVPPAVRVEGRKHAHRRVELAARELAEQRAHGVEVTGRQRVQPAEDLPCALDVGVHRARCRRSGLRHGPALR